MPGPKSTPKASFKFPVGKPNRKRAARLKARQSDYDDLLRKDATLAVCYHKPGSQNRNK